MTNTEAMRAEFLDDLVVTMETAAAHHHLDFVRVELPREQWAKVATILRASRSSEDKGVPEGWKLVPIEPTREMWAAVNKLDDQMAAGGYDGKGCSIEQAWNCLIENAPQPPQPVETSSADPVDGGWYWVLYEGLNDNTAWAPAQRERNHWNSVAFRGIPLKEVKVGKPIRATEAGTESAEQFTHDELQEMADSLDQDHDGTDFEPECPGCTAYRKISAMLAPPQSAPVDG